MTTSKLVDVIPWICEYLGSTDVQHLELTCSTCSTLIRNDHNLWSILLYREIGAIRIECPPSIFVELSSPRECFLLWKKSFNEYTSEEIRLAKCWWDRMENWLRSNFLSIYRTLRPPPSWDDILEAENNLGYRIPRLLKLFYRFHDGQYLEYDDMIHTGRRHTREVVIQSIYSGLFGGISFYEQIINTRFLPLIQMVALSKRLPRLEILPAIPSWTSLSSWLSQKHPPSHFRDFEYFHSFPKVCVFACSAPIQGIDKVFCCTEGSEEMSDGLFVNLDGMKYLTPACAPPKFKGQKSAPNRCPNVDAGGCLFSWLYEYLDRLESKIYIVQPVNQTEPGYSNPAAHIYDEISLFPVQEAELISMNSNPSFDESKCAAGTCVSTAISHGISICASSVFVPSSTNARNGIFWTYRIRMRLLEDCPNRPVSLRHCQLARRHWICREPTTNSFGQCVVGEFTDVEVHGEAVIGLYPILSIENSQGGYSNGEWPFAYQSCFTAKAFPGSISGCVDFAPISSPELGFESTPISESWSKNSLLDYE